MVSEGIKPKESSRRTNKGDTKALQQSARLQGESHAQGTCEPGSPIHQVRLASKIGSLTWYRLFPGAAYLVDFGHGELYYYGKCSAAQGQLW